MGVSGSGKTTIGRLLAESLGWSFVDGDDRHPRSNLDKMRRGLALTDEDREPWLRRLHKDIRSWLASNRDVVEGDVRVAVGCRRSMMHRRGDSPHRALGSRGDAAGATIPSPPTEFGTKTVPIGASEPSAATPNASTPPFPPVCT